MGAGGLATVVAGSSVGVGSAVGYATGSFILGAASGGAFFVVGGISVYIYNRNVTRNSIAQNEEINRDIDRKEKRESELVDEIDQVIKQMSAVYEDFDYVECEYKHTFIKKGIEVCVVTKKFNGKFADLQK